MRFASCLLLLGCTPDPAPDDPAVVLLVATEPAEFSAAVSTDRYQSDLETLVGPRDPGTAGWLAAQERCASVFEAAGLEVTRHVYATGTNVVGIKPGTANTGAVVVSAHYDSVSDCDGADDNATGVAGVLESARILGAGTWENDLIVACWDEEEDGLVGSEAWVNAFSAAGGAVALAFSLEMIGFASDAPDSQTLPTGLDLLFSEATAAVAANDSRGDFIAFVADDGATAPSETFAEHAGDLAVVPILIPEALVVSPLLGDLQRSDHASFWAAGYSAVMVTDTANFRNSGYHCYLEEDTLDRLDQGFATNVIRATVGAAAALLKATNAEE